MEDPECQETSETVPGSQDAPEPDGAKDEVQEQSEESFPASDPPSY